MKLIGAVLDTPQMIDNALARYLDDLCYIKRKGYNEGSKCYSGMTHLWPELKQYLVLSARSLMSWMRLANMGEGGPIPLGCLLLIVQRMLEIGEMEAAFVTLLAEDGYLRESDWGSIHWGDVSADDVGGGAPQVAMILGAGARGLSTKTGSNHGLVVETELLRYWIFFMLAAGALSGPLVAIEAASYRRIW